MKNLEEKKALLYDLIESKTTAEFLKICEELGEIRLVVKPNGDADRNLTPLALEVLNTYAARNIGQNNDLTSKGR